ncbi:wax ester/triacylglycerol synthase domain-containing protein [Saccharothrix australiensis]|uniref:diacylglycerol O-acyltransferase n=1 Tax=Saccharothrix australiensis TaxID=2072 RepID=A0A495VW60_9PSEU|nr:wax ester/triacylglycerol synthase domain-containing protein [Saccharothrix australiensis]RKT53612.1 WS/DGAT/MGAT family acyltransferase [Saccharothrix australiensis]
MPTPPADPPSWVAEPRMSEMETMFWRGETDPRIRVTVLAVEVLDRAPDWERLVRRHELTSRLVPRLRQRVVEPPLRLGRPWWRDDPLFDLAHHLRRVRLPAPGATRQLLDLAGTAASAPFDRTRPLWEAILVEGLDGDRAAYVLKLHHSLCDGIGAAQLAAVLHEAATPDHPVGPIRHPEPPAADGAVSERARAAKLLSAVLGAPRSAHAVLKATVLPAAAPSPLLSGRSRTRSLSTMTLPTADLRAVGRAVGGSMNDAYLALLLGAFGRYHEHFGVRRAELPVLMPISTRTARSALGGNQFASHRLAGPMCGAGFAERVRLVRAAVAAVRGGTALGALGVLARCATPLPAPVIAAAEKMLFRGNDLIASNFPGTPERVRLAGALVEAVYPFAPVVLGAANAVLVSYAANCHIGVNLDPAAIREPLLLMEFLHREWEEARERFGRAGSSRGAGPQG